MSDENYYCGITYDGSKISVVAVRVEDIALIEVQGPGFGVYVAEGKVQRHIRVILPSTAYTFLSFSSGVRSLREAMKHANGMRLKFLEDYEQDTKSNFWRPKHAEAGQLSLEET